MSVCTIDRQHELFFTREARNRYRPPLALVSTLTLPLPDPERHVPHSHDLFVPEHVQHDVPRSDGEEPDHDSSRAVMKWGALRGRHEGSVG